MKTGLPYCSMDYNYENVSWHVTLEAAKQRAASLGVDSIVLKQVGHFERPTAPVAMVWVDDG